MAALVLLKWRYCHSSLEDTLRAVNLTWGDKFCNAHSDLSNNNNKVQALDISTRKQFNLHKCISTEDVCAPHQRWGRSLLSVDVLHYEQLSLAKKSFFTDSLNGVAFLNPHLNLKPDHQIWSMERKAMYMASWSANLLMELTWEQQWLWLFNNKLKKETEGLVMAA